MRTVSCRPAEECFHISAGIVASAVRLSRGLTDITPLKMCFQCLAVHTITAIFICLSFSVYIYIYIYIHIVMGISFQDQLPADD